MGKFNYSREGFGTVIPLETIQPKDTGDLRRKKMTMSRP